MKHPETRRFSVALALAVLLGPVATAWAGEETYLLGGGLYEFSDSARDSDDGAGVQLGVGLSIPGRPGEAAEFSLKGVQRDRQVGSGSDAQYALFGNFTKAFAAMDGIGGATPYVLAGVGAVQEDVRGEGHLHAGADAGVGLRWPLGIGGWALRSEVLVQAQLNDKSAPRENALFDMHVGLSLQIPIGRRSSVDAVPEVPPAQECPTRVVDPVTGRSDCISDADRDGISDALDQCPATPAGTAVDAKGCTILGVVDADGDGVLDQVDACPSTISGMVVDATGCLVEQTVTLRSVNFESGSARLTDDARLALNEIARTLKGQPHLSAEISGHTDDAGNDNYNLQLSQQRAESVRQYLIGRGVAGERLVAIGMGETQPVAGNDTEEGRVANRRVEFKVRVQ